LIFDSGQDSRVAHNLSISNIPSNAKDISLEDTIKFLLKEELIQL